MAIKVLSKNDLILIDDDPTEAILLERYVLRSRLRNPVRTFQSPQDFLEHLNAIESGLAEMPALVLVDVRMAQYSGFDLVSEVRNREPFKSVPLLVMFSNSDEVSDKNRATEVGADGYVVKPGSGDAYVEFLNSLWDSVAEA